MANMLAGTKIVPEPWCPCHKCMCCGVKAPRTAINHTKRKARRKENRFWRKDQRENAA